MRVVDASILVAALTDGGAAGEWAAAQLQGFRLAAPYLLPSEAANVLRRAESSGHISGDAAAQAYADLLRLRLHLYPFAPFAQRIWELRGATSSYDAWYVALAEGLGAALLTLDRQLHRASGPRCVFVQLPEAGFRH